jgi:hypothetical protein
MNIKPAIILEWVVVESHSGPPFGRPLRIRPQAVFFL